MRGIVHELPEAAAARLTELQMRRDAVLDAQRSAASRANNLPADASHLRAKLEAERDRHAAQHRQLSMVCSAIAQWHVQLRLPPGSVLELAPPLDIAPKPGETIAEAIGTIRAEIAAVKRQIAEVRAAPLRLESKMEAVTHYLDGLMRQARPRVGFDVKGNAKISFTEDLVIDKSSVLGLLAWIMGPEELATVFAGDFEQEDAPDALSPAERAEQLGELAEQLLELERRECALMTGDESIRSDTDPRAYLNVQIVQAPAPAQAVA
jgi:hypothetical protein